MLAFLLQTSEWLRSGHLYPFAVFMTVIWLLWGIKAILARQYRPWQADYATTTSVIIPVVDEAEDLFRSVLERITTQQPTEVIVVINGPRNSKLEAICDELEVRWAWTKTPGKRRALQIGTGMARGEIAVLVDSDTVWTQNTLRELVKPFRDPEIGGVTTRQRIIDPDRSILTRWADWLENIRNEYSMPAMSVLGTVGCLPGRTIAFRRQILLDYMPQFLNEPFLGVFLEVSDDRTLTNYTLQAGYRTVLQSTSMVYTDAPTSLGKLAKQQFRWARGSQYNTLRMLPWMLRNSPVLAVFYLADIIIPFILISSFVSWAHALATGLRSPLYAGLPLPPGGYALVFLIALSGVMTVMGLGIRFGRHFAYRPNDLAYLPAFMLINTFLLMPVRVLGFFRMAHNAGWGTRLNGFAGEQRRRNPQALIPYVIGGFMLMASVIGSV